MIGRIIFANVLAQPLWKYFTFVERIEKHSLFEKWHSNGWLLKENLSIVSSLFRNPTRKERVVGKYVKQLNGKYDIQYFNTYFQTFYRIQEDLFSSFSKGTVEKRLLHKIRQVNSRNILNHHLLKTIAKEQAGYLSSGEIHYLKPLTQAKLAKVIKSDINNVDRQTHRFPHVCPTWISRLINNLSVILPDGSTQHLEALLPSQRDRAKLALLDILEDERKTIIDGVLKEPYNDSRLQYFLHSRHGIVMSRRNITYARKELGISSAQVRSKDFWYFHATPFSSIYTLAPEEINAYAPQTSGVYKIRLSKEQITYPKGTSPIIYIGRAQNLKKRLKEHMLTASKNEIIKYYLKHAPCNFRFLIAKDTYIQEEKHMYELFTHTFGAPPIGNHIKP
ncbi:MAG: RNA polymerase factor sigma-54 [Candidatus Anammoxibacter sp.]